MSISYLVNLENGKIWGIGSGLFVFPPQEVESAGVIVLIDQVEGMTNEEIGRFVRSLLPEAEYASILDSAQFIAHNTPIYTIDECLEWLLRLGEYAGKNEKIDSAITGLQDRIKSLTTKGEKKRLARIRRSQFGKNREQISLALIERDGYECGHCRTQDDLTIDHIEPISKGGSDELKNLRFLCRKCNSAKSDKDSGLTGGSRR
jgi:hypothetical protein